MNMTVLFKKCTYGLLLITTTLIGYCNATLFNGYTNIELTEYANGTVNVGNGDETINITEDKNYTYCVYLEFTLDGTNTPFFMFKRNPGAYSSEYKTFGIYGNDGIDSVFMCGDSVQGSSRNMSLIFDKTSAPSNFTVDYTIYKVGENQNNNDCPTCEICQECQTCEEQYTKLECQTEYSLIPIEDIDQTYCINNNLCPIIEGTGNIQRSALYINEIQHLGKPIINIDIPEEIERDYTTNDNAFNLIVEGYGYDEEKITNIINTQNYKPTPEEMSELVGKIANFLPLVAITLLILRAWRLIKKLIFKS